MEINYLVKESVEHSVEIENKNFCFFEGTDGCGFQYGLVFGRMVQLPPSMS